MCCQSYVEPYTYSDRSWLDTKTRIKDLSVYEITAQRAYSGVSLLKRKARCVPHFPRQWCQIGLSITVERMRAGVGGRRPPRCVGGVVFQPFSSWRDTNRNIPCSLLHVNDAQHLKYPNTFHIQPREEARIGIACIDRSDGPKVGIPLGVNNHCNRSSNFNWISWWRRGCGWSLANVCWWRSCRLHCPSTMNARSGFVPHRLYSRSTERVQDILAVMSSQPTRPLLL